MLGNYLQMLGESLEKKLDILTAIEEKSLEQSALIKDEASYEAIDKNMDDKVELISKLTILDEGFESLYEKIKKTLEADKDNYKPQIKELQQLIAQVTEKSASIQAIEARNKKAMETRFSAERKRLSDKRMISNVSYDYYKTSSKLQAVGPQFLDKKN